MEGMGNQRKARKREPRENMSWYFWFVAQTQTPQTSRTTSPMQAAYAWLLLMLLVASAQGKMVLQQDSGVWKRTMIFDMLLEVMLQGDCALVEKVTAIVQDCCIPKQAAEHGQHLHPMMVV